MAGRKTKYGSDRTPEIIRLYTEENLSLHAIFKKTGIHPQIVKRRLLSSGITIRNKSEAMKLSHKHRRENS